MAKSIIVIHKQVGKKLEFKKIENTPEEFEKLLGGKIEILSFNELEDVFFICRKYRERLKPNVYINITFGRLDETIRGDLIIVGKDFKSLTREQALTYGELVTRESYNYSHFDENGKYLSNNQLRKRAKMKKLQERKETKAEQEKPILPTGEFVIENSYKQEETEISANNEEMLDMILKIQAIILQFIKNNSSVQ